MKKNYLLSFSSMALVCCMAWSCSQDNGPVYPESESEEIQLTAEEALALHCSLNGTAVSKSEIMNAAAGIAAYLDAGEGGLATKSSFRRIASLTPVTDISSVTKSWADEDTLAYIVSFGEDLGYAVLSADVRTDPIIAICPEGNLADNEDSGAPNAESFSEAMKQAIARQIEKAQDVQDSLLAMALAKIELTAADSTDLGTKAANSGIRTEYYYGEWGNAWRKGPFVNVTWGQGWPYNRNMRVYNERHCPAGCVAVAVAQIMSYWRNPAEYDWNALTENALPISDRAISEAARLVYDVAYGVKTDFEAERSSASSNNARKCYSDNGFEVGRIKRYDFEKVKWCLNNNMPLQAFGYDNCLLSSDFLYWFFPSGGHSWVIDGLLCQQRRVTIRIFGGTVATKAKGTAASTVNEYHTTQSQYLLHCNWGWEGVRDGWYAEGVFDAEKGAEIPDSYDNKNIEGTDFQYGVKCIYDIRK